MSADPTAAAEWRWTQKRVGYLALFLLFLILWIGPITWNGVTGKGVPGAGLWANNMYRVARLFTKRIPTWSNYYVEIFHEGMEKPTALPLTAFSDMKPFGYTPRLHRMISKSSGNSSETALRGAMAAYIKQKFENQNPFLPPIREIRLIRVVYQSGAPELAHPDGHWTIPPLESIPNSRRRVLGSFRPQTELLEKGATLE